MDKEELSAQLDWLAKHGFIEVVGMTDDGEWLYAPTDKGKNATIDQMNELLEEEIEEKFWGEEN